MQDMQEGARPANLVRLVPQLGHVNGVSTAVFSPDGRWVLTGSWDGARLWETATGVEVRQFGQFRIGSIASVAFSPDGRWVLTGGTEGTARLWETATGVKVRQFGQIRIGSRTSVAFSPDGRWVLTGGTEGTARLWETATGVEVRQFGQIRDGSITSVAFSPDGRWVLTGSSDGTVRLWETATGAQIRQFQGHGDTVTSVAFSRDGRWVLTGEGGHALRGKHGTARLWETAMGVEVRQLRHYKGVSAVAFSPDGQWVLTGSEDRTARLWETATGVEVRQFGQIGIGSITSVVFSSDGRWLLTGSEWDPTARLWDVATGVEVRQFTGHVARVSAVAFSPDGQWVLTGSEDRTARLWETATGQKVREFRGRAEGGTAVAFSPDGRWVLTGEEGNALRGEHGTARLWETATGVEVRQFRGQEGIITGVAFSPDGRWVLTAEGIDALRGKYGTARLWETATGAEVRQFRGQEGIITGVAFSPCGRWVLTGSDDHTVWLWETATGAQIRQFQGHDDTVTSVAFSSDGRWVLTGSFDGTVRLWETATGAQIRRFFGYAMAVAFSPDGRKVLAGGGDGTVWLWETATGAEVRQFRGHSGVITAIASSPDNRWVLTGSSDGTAGLWERESSIQVARLISFQDGTWAVIDAEGRFDTNNLEEIKGIHWVMPDDPMHALPLEIFMRDYYEPRLLAKVLAGKPLPSIPSLAELNRAQPKVEIVGVERERDAQGRPRDTFAVTVRVAGASETFGLERQQRRMETGVYDLRLFRDGQLVAQEPSAGSRATTVGLSADDELQQWRHERRVVDLKDGTRQIVFKGIRLPRRAGIKEVKFSAYAFNEDRVKSQTAQAKPFTIPADLSPRKPKAYLVTVGVNAFEDDHWDLDFAVNDATQLGQVLKPRLEAQHDAQGQPRYEDVVGVELTAEARIDQEGTRHLTKVQANKAQIEAVLKTLAGQRVKADALQGINHADKLRRANPEDLVLLAFSTHGEVDLRGRFYLLPHDIGSKSTEKQRRARAISNDELSEWLQGLDAIDLVMIVDACHSAASVESPDFKPGPMGSRGLGQLAYDKGMRILAASQSTESARETREIKMGLLSFALVREGLEDDQADYKPKDKQIWLSEWLSYAAERVPGLYTDPGRAKGDLLMAQKQTADKTTALQQPALFDFARKRDALLGSVR
jgi:WD40 repeat protein